MAKPDIPIKIDGFECVNDMAQAVLNYSYKGRTLKEWADSISEPKTNADRIRAMTVEEWARLLARGCHATRECPTICDSIHTYGQVVKSCEDCWLDWLKDEVKE